MTEPDDRELERYLEGKSPVSRRYREASRETSPPDLDEAILARARAEARRRPSLNRVLTPVALAASVVLGVNLAWNLYQVEPVPVAETQRLAKSAEPTYAPDPAPAPVEQAPAAPAPAPEAKRKAEAPPPAALEDRLARESELAATAARERDRNAAQAKAAAKDEERARAGRQASAEMQRREMLQAQDSAQSGPGAAAGAAAEAPAAALAPETAPARPAPMTEAEKIDRLIDYVGQLDGVDFIRNGKEYTAAEAADHMRLKRKRAGDRVKTAEDFIRLCASFSTQTGEAYLIRFPDGRTRTAEDVLREQLATLP
jgi:hypothetical protein